MVRRLLAERFMAWTAAAVAVGFVLRLALRLARGPEDFWQNGYRLYALLAHSIAAGHGYALPGQGPTAFRVPLYPLFLAAVGGGEERGFVAVAVAQSAVSAGLVACAALLARDRFGPLAGVLAAIVAALYPYFVVHDTALQESGLFAFLTPVAVLLVQRARRRRSAVAALIAGLALGAAVLTRATLAPFAVLAIAWLALTGSKERSAAARWRKAAICAAAFATTLAPWLAWSHAVNGRLALGTELGIAVSGGNNSMTFSHYPEGSIDRSRAAAHALLTPAEHAEFASLAGDEIAASDWLLERGLAYIASHPWETALGAVRKNLAAFGWLPSPRHGLLGNSVHAASYGPVMVLGFWSLWRERRRWRDDALIYALFAAFVAVTGAFWGHTSHRAYLDVYLIVFAAGLVAARLERGRARYEAGVPA